MSTASAYLTVAGLGVDVVYKDIKNLHISVYPPVGHVRVAAPDIPTKIFFLPMYASFGSLLSRQRPIAVPGDHRDIPVDVRPEELDDNEVLASRVLHGERRGGTGV